MSTRVLLSGNGYPGTCRLLAIQTAVGALWILLSGCGAAAQLVGEETDTQDGGAQPVQDSTVPREMSNVMGVPAAMMEAVLDDAARRSGKNRIDMKVVSAQAVTWSDGSLGCPEPGMMYTQALVPGYRIVVQAGEDQLEYHASVRGMPKFCPAGRAAAPITDPGI